ncbi:hypothetical protein PBI_SCTP2_15 [Salicola phage SCTP-2]|nr:hypothetical protein PBI_SCTP2_15 [Salicola phage SCTP-2]
MMFRSLKQMHDFGPRQVLNKIYFDMIALAIMYKEYEYSEEAANYAKMTVMHSGFNNFKINATELYNSFYYIMNIGEFELSKNDTILLKRTSLDVHAYIRLLRKLSSGSLPLTELDRFLKLITKYLYIEDNMLRSLGRLAVNWNRLGIREKRITMDKLSKYGTINYRRSVITQYINEMASNVRYDHEQQRKERHREIDLKKARADDTIGVSPSEKKPEKSKKDKGSDYNKPLMYGLAGYALAKFLGNNKENKK